MNIYFQIILFDKTDSKPFNFQKKKQHSQLIINAISQGRVTVLTHNNIIIMCNTAKIIHQKT